MVRETEFTDNVHWTLGKSTIVGVADLFPVALIFMHLYYDTIKTSQYIELLSLFTSIVSRAPPLKIAERCVYDGNIEISTARLYRHADPPMI